MERKKAQEFLFQQLEQQFPSEECCRFATTKGIERSLLTSVDFKPIRDFLEMETLGLTTENIPSHLWPELILWAILLTERSDGCEIAYWDTQIWNLDHPETDNILKKIKKCLKHPKEEIGHMEIQDFLTYVKKSENTVR